MRISRCCGVILVLFLLCSSGMSQAAVSTERLPALSQYGEAPYAEVYRDWLNQGYQPVGPEVGPITVAGSDYADVSDEASFSTSEDILYWTVDGGWVEYEVIVDKAGLYNIEVEYLPLGEHVFDIERGLMINGEYPFWEARRFLLDRKWRNQQYPFMRDSFGNEVRSFQEQIFEWARQRLVDVNGRYALPYQVFFEEGTHRIRFVGLRSQVALRSVSLVAPEMPAPYNTPAPTNSVTNWSLSIEAENPARKSHSSVMVHASGDPAVSPREDGVTIYNILGWSKGGQWAEWDFSVPEDGYYKIGLRFRQNGKTNMPSYRKIEIDGSVPYEELIAYPFPYDFNWQAAWLSEPSGTELLFYLPKGEHTLRLTAVNELVQPTIQTILDVISELRALSLTITMATGNSDDRFRDWDIDRQIPDAPDIILSAAQRLRDEYARLQQIGGKAPDAAANLIVSAEQLEKLAEDIDRLPLRYKQLAVDPGSITEVIGNTILALQEEPLQIDQIFVASADTPLPAGKSSFAHRAWVTLKNFFISFTRDYNLVGDDDEDALTIWVARGRDFVSLMQQLTDQEFTPKTGIKVSYSLMPNPEQQLILANSNGTPPDIATSVWYTLPVNLASRGALVDLRQFPDFDEVASRFHPGALLSYHYIDGFYALPETQNFWVLFYRKDIADALGIELPDTWDDVIDILPTLQENGMNFYNPVSAGTGIKALFVMAPFFYQQGAELFTSDGLRTTLNTPEALAGFRLLTDLYNVYSLDNFVAWFFQNFRSGDIPLGVSDYNTYVQLRAAAPELEGLWGIKPMPGISTNGEVIRWAPGAAQATVMFELSDKKEQAWEWIKWWTSAETQAKFGNEVEAMFGVSYRWNTANMEAIHQIPWTLEELAAIMEQWRWLKDIPQVPGGYMLERELSFAWNRVVIGTSTGHQNPRQALQEADRNVRRELLRKQREFGLIDENERPLVHLNIPVVNEPWDWKGVDGQ